MLMHYIFQQLSGFLSPCVSPECRGRRGQRAAPRGGAGKTENTALPQQSYHGRW